jgi:hypothetical protein
MIGLLAEWLTLRNALSLVAIFTFLIVLLVRSIQNTTSLAPFH